MKYVILIALALFSSCSDCERDPLTILQIGGCDKNGYCGVQYDDMSYGREYFPVVGEQKKGRCKK